MSGSPSVETPAVVHRDEGHSLHPWPHDQHRACAMAWFDVADQRCRSTNADTCCFCGKAIRR
jgi:hypothetical protein